MIKVSRLADYAVVILATLARSDERLVTASGVSEKTGLPEPTVAKVMKLLARDNVILSIRGATGGYKLTETPQNITVARIVRAVDGPISLTTCVEGSVNTCDYACSCPVKGRWDGVNMAIRDALEGVSLADMINFEPYIRAAHDAPELKAVKP